MAHQKAGLLACMCLASAFCICRALCSSVIKGPSLCIYIYICLVQDRLLHPADGPKLMAKTHTGLLALHVPCYVSLVKSAWCKVDGNDPYRSAGLHVP